MHRLNSQASDTERLAIADVVIDSDGTLEDTLRQADELWAMAAAAAVSRESPARRTPPDWESGATGFALPVSPAALTLDGYAHPRRSPVRGRQRVRP